MASDLATALSARGLARKHVILALLADSNEPLMPAAIKDLAAKHGKPKVKKWNVSRLLADLDGLVARHEDGWAITDNGRRILNEMGLSSASPTTNPQFELRKCLNKVTDEQTRAFVDEAIRALEHGLPRSAVVLSWVGAVSMLHAEVLNAHLAEFNKELVKRNAKAKPIRQAADLGLLKEYDFLQIARGAGIISKNVKEELESCLRLRNSCGHPTNLKIGEHRIASHIETLILNVYQPLSQTT